MMKKFGAFLAAVVIAMTVSTTVLAVPEDESSTQTSQSDSENSKKEESKQESKKESSQTSAKEKTDPEKMNFTECEIPEIGMHINLPDNMYILTADISPDDPALTAVKLTKQEVEKNFTENDTVIKAFAKDFSYDITVTTLKTDRTKAIGNLSSLAEKELQNVIEELMKNDYAKGNSINTYNNVLFLTLDMEYTNGDTHIYGKQEYTIVNGTNVIITFQSHNGQMDQQQMKLLDKIMNSVKFDGVADAAEVSDITTATVNELDIRYILIFAFVLIAIITFAIMIIVAARYRNSKLEDSDDELVDTGKGGKMLIKTPKNAIPVDDIKTPEKPAPEKKQYDSSLFEKADENVIFKNEKLAEEKRKREETRLIPRLDSTMELTIPDNPYTPVGKAEPVQQPALSVTSEIAKLSTISAEAAKAEKEKTTEDDDNGDIVFAESAPKAKTDIEQIGENVFDAPSAKNDSDTEEKPEEELSEYEKRFGKNRTVAAVTESAATIVPVDEDEKRQSKFEKHFGKVQPAQAPAKPENDTISAVDEIIRQEEKNSLTERSSEITVTVKPPKDNLVKTDDDRPLVRITKSVVPMTKEQVKPESKAEEAKPEEIKTETKAEVTKSEGIKTETKAEETKPEEIKTETKAEEAKPEGIKTETKAEEAKPEEIKTETKAEEAKPEGIKTETKAEEAKPEEIKTETKAEEIKPEEVKDEIKPEEKTEALTQQKPVAQTRPEKKKKRGLFAKFREKLFEGEGEEEEIPIAPDADEDKEKTPAGNGLTYAAVAGENNKENKAGSGNEGVEIYRSPDIDKNPHVELSLKKDEDGNVIIDSISDITGKPVKVSLKDGNAEIKAKAEAEKEAETEKKPEIKSEPENKSEAKPESEEKTEEKSGSEIKKEELSETEAKDDTKSDAEVKTEEKSEPETKTEDKPETEVKDETKSGAEAKPEAEEKPATENAAAKKMNEQAKARAEQKKKDEEAKAKAMEERFSYEKLFEKKDVSDEKEGSEEKSVSTVQEKSLSSYEKKFGLKPSDESDKKESTVSETDNDTKKSGEASAFEKKFGIDNAAAKTAAAKTAAAVVAGTAEKAAAGAAAITTAVAAGTAAAVTAAVASSADEEKNKEVITETKSEEEIIETKPEEKTAEETKPEDNTVDSETVTAEPKAENAAEEEPAKADIQAVPEEITEPEPVFVFERDAGIVFEYAADNYEPYEPKNTPLTDIPRLESVNAAEYNKMIEQLHKDQYKPKPKPQPVPQPIPQPVPEPESQKTDFYDGTTADDTLDPFAPGSGEMTYDELQKKTSVSFGQRLKKSFGKIFGAAEGEDE